MVECNKTGIPHHGYINRKQKMYLHSFIIPSTKQAILGMIAINIIAMAATFDFATFHPGFYLNAASFFTVYVYVCV